MSEPKLRADAQRNRTAVLDAAAEIFVEAGVDVPVERIAERAGVGMGTVYRHFPSKEALFEAVMADRLTQVAEEIEQGLGSAERGGIAGLIRRLADEVGLKRMLLDRLTDEGVGFSAQDMPAMGQLLDAVDRAARMARDRGDLRADVTLDDFLAVTVAVAQSPAGDRLIELAIEGLRA